MYHLRAGYTLKHLSMLLSIGLLVSAPVTGIQSCSTCPITCANSKQLIANIQCLTGSSLDALGDITQPGYYRLCGNVQGPVTIKSNNVVLDLNGYVVSSATPTTSYGIMVDNGTNVIIKNGIVGPIASTSTTINPSWKNRGIVVAAQSSNVPLRT